MEENTLYTNKHTGEKVRLEKIIPIYNGLGIDHYVFKRADGRTITLPIGEVKREWVVTNK